MPTNDTTTLAGGQSAPRPSAAAVEAAIERLEVATLNPNDRAALGAAMDCLGAVIDQAKQGVER